MLLHHTLGNGDFNVFANMSSQISCEVAKLNNPLEIASQIDHALQTCWLRSQPIYIMLPTDMVQVKVEGARLETPIDMSEPANDPEAEDFVVAEVLKNLTQAKHPVILVDACAIRHRVVEEVHQLVDKTNLPVFVTPMGKGAVDENHPNYGGVYAGSGSHPAQAKEIIESSDLLLTIGALKVRTNWSLKSQFIKSVLIWSHRATSTLPASHTGHRRSTPSTSTALTASFDTRHIQPSA